MKISIDDGVFTFSADFSRNDRLDGGMLEEYCPKVSEVCEAFYSLLENCYPKENIRGYVCQGKDQ